MSLKFELLSALHNRIDFDCGEESLNLYLNHFARQDSLRGLARTFIIRNKEIPIILGYYTLCSAAIEVQALPTKLLKKLPKRPVPVVRLARLAVDEQHQGQGYGELLLIDALYRTSAAGESIGIHGMIVDAKHEKASQFYKKYGFQSLSMNPLLLFSSLKDLRRQFIS